MITAYEDAYGMCLLISRLLWISSQVFTRCPGTLSMTIQANILRQHDMLQLIKPHICLTPTSHRPCWYQFIQLELMGVSLRLADEPSTLRSRVRNPERPTPDPPNNQIIEKWTSVICSILYHLNIWVAFAPPIPVMCELQNHQYFPECRWTIRVGYV